MRNPWTALQENLTKPRGHPTDVKIRYYLLMAIEWAIPAALALTLLATC